MPVASIIFILTLLARHAPQVLLDLRNYRRHVISSTAPGIPAFVLILTWLIIHTIATIHLFMVWRTIGYWEITGIGIVIIGAVFGLWAILSLAKARAYNLELDILEGATFVHTQLYSVVRHPLRLTLAVETFGSVVLVRHVCLIPIWILLVIAQIIRSKREDILLREHYGVLAVQYQRHVPAVNIFVGLWRWYVRRCTVSLI